MNPFRPAIAALSTIAALLAPPAGADDVPELACLVHPHSIAEVSAASDGVLAAVSAERGDRVTAGQEVARLNSRVEESILALARARAKMDAEVRARRTSLEYAKRRQQRSEELSQKKSISRQEQDEADTEAALAELALIRAQQDRALAALEVERAEANLEMRVVRSPVDGIVVERMLSPGESVEGRPIMRIAQIDPLRVEVIVPVAHLGNIREDMPAEVRLEAPVGGTHGARVTVVDRVVDAASGTFGVRLALPNPDYRLAGGLRCRVRFGG